jgi:alpha-acetolactate decarboxylase
MKRTVPRTYLFACAIGWVAASGCTRDVAPASAAQDASADPAPAPVEDASAASASSAASAQVRWFGALSAIMHEGRTEAAAQLADVLPGPHAWGVGALEGLAGEVTILDDRVWLARSKPDGTASISHGEIADADFAQGAALLVVANADAWDELPVSTNIAWSGLDSCLESQLIAHGEALDAPVLLRIDGPVATLRWHVIDGSKMQPGAGHAAHARSAVSGVLEQADAQLVGFFSRAHQGVFTHMGSHSHFHVVTRDGALTGHVDGVDLVAGARLLLPRR